MDSVMKTVQRYLYIGNDVPFFLHSPHTPLDVELGKRVLAPALLLSSAERTANETKTFPEEMAQSKKKSKKATAQTAAADANLVAPEVEKLTLQDTNKDAVKTTTKDATEDSSAAPAEEKQLKSNEIAVQSVQKTVQQPLSPVLALIKLVVRRKVLRRADEWLFALAYCAREFPTAEDRHAAYDMFVELVCGSRDLFSFLAYYMQLATQSGHAGFGSGMRKAITRWYEKHSALQLADLLGKARSHEGWSHRDVVAKTHLKLACPEKQALIDAVMKRTSQLLAGKPTEKKKGKKKGRKSKVRAASVMAADVIAPPKPKPSESAQRYQTLRLCRSAPTVSKVLEYIKQHDMTLDMMPLHFRRSVKVWEALYPSITYRELLEAALPMHDFRLLKEGEPNSKAYATALEQRLRALEEEQIHPIEVQQIANLFENRRRYEHGMKDFIHSFYMPPNIEVNYEVLQQLQRAVEHSFSHHPKTGIRYYIALDLRKHHEKKTVFRSSLTSCFHASVMLAFSIFKREKNVTVVAFTEQEDTLQPVQFTDAMSWKQAVSHCQSLLLPKTKVSLTAPIARAEADKLKVDMFITITDSVIRVNPTRVPPYEALCEYRRKVKLNLSRYIAVSLANHDPAFDFSKYSKATGILEMVGYNGTTAKIIEAFAKSLFV